MAVTDETVWAFLRPWTTSDDVDQLAPALVAALGELEDVPRGRTANVGTYNYRYADLGAVLGAVRPVLARHGLCLSQTPEVDDGAVVVATTIWHASGQWLAAPPLRLPAGDTAQSVGSAITYARRYTALAVLGMATEDDDGAAAGRSANPPRLMAQSTLDKFRAATVDAGLDAHDVAAIVSMATDGRTDNVEEVLQTEVRSLGEALDAYRAPGPPATPDGPQRAADDTEGVTAP